MDSIFVEGSDDVVYASRVGRNMMVRKNCGCVRDLVPQELTPEG